MKRSILIMKCGSTYPDIVSRHGDFEDWFITVFQQEGAECEVVDVTGPFSVDPGRYDGLLLTGSLASAYRSEPWIVNLADWIRTSLPSSLPTLGVCFGHQILARALGGEVKRCSNGLEIGTSNVSLTEEGKNDPLFAGFPGGFSCQETHVDEVVSLPEGGTVLARNSHSSIQACVFREKIRGVQFHPEMTLPIITAVVRDLKEKLHDADAILAGLQPTPAASRVLSNFIHRICCNSG